MRPVTFGVVHCDDTFPRLLCSHTGGDGGVALCAMLQYFDGHFEPLRLLVIFVYMLRWCFSRLQRYPCCCSGHKNARWGSSPALWKRRASLFAKNLRPTTLPAEVELVEIFYYTSHRAVV